MNFSCLRTIEEFDQLKVNVEMVRLATSFMEFVGHNTTTKSLSFAVFFIRIPLYVLIMIVSLVGNITLILVIMLNRFMRKPTNFFILNLAVCDLSILFSCMWVEIVLSISNYWVLGELFCKINSYMQMLSIVASVLTLSVVSCDRYMGVMYPLSFRMTTKRSFACILAIWLLSSIVAFPSFLYRTYTVRHWLDFVERQCDDLGWPISLSLNDKGCGNIIRRGKRIYYISIVFIFFIVPMIVMSISYSILIRKIWLVGMIGESEEYSKRKLRRKKNVSWLVAFRFSFFRFKV